MTRLLLVRHGETDWNLEHRFQGQSDIPLNETGQQQAVALGKRLAGEEMDAIYASDLRRTWQTALQIVAQHDLEIIPEPRLREMSFGRWEGLTFRQMTEEEPRIIDGWGEFMNTVGPPEGESIPVFAARLQTALDVIAAAHPDQTVLLVTHGGVIMLLLCLFMEIPVERYWRFRVSQASISVVDVFPEGAIINRINDTCHLDGMNDES
ncbi:MAG: alpha-ribazole phosphatase [Anaerolinea sp. 4484_236]|nr:MAG: alpha-ribazole phosphatase [Anaerolinea sp. 4484_236]